jgi:1-aminocyclopropane-1-carboxylate deaminase/D-cysteine desulfhydrase-like pyridoxal-dependent ACC family enzyme
MPLFARFPALSGIPWVSLARFPTPVVEMHGLGVPLLVKRDDLSADPLGGNKVRALEFLLGGMATDDRVVTVGAAGSTHALAVATYGKRLGLDVKIGRWKQEVNPAAERVAERVSRELGDDRVFASPVNAYAWAWRERLLGAKWIAAGGSTPLGVLGHVNAGLELVAQIDAGVVAQPKAVVVPLGTGGTAAGLALAFAIADRDIRVVGARVVPRVVARLGHVLGLARHTSRLIERTTGEQVPRVRAAAIEIVHDTYGGAYGRETDAARAATSRLRLVSDIGLDGTYSAKTFALALERAPRELTLFWLTFDSRILSGS